MVCSELGFSLRSGVSGLNLNISWKVKWCRGLTSLIVHLHVHIFYIGARDTCLPLGIFCFQFYAVFNKKLALVLVPHVWEILDPPLYLNDIKLYKFSLVFCEIGVDKQPKFPCWCYCLRIECFHVSARKRMKNMLRCDKAFDWNQKTTKSNDKLHIAKCQNLFKFIAFALGFQTSICLQLKMLVWFQLLRKPASKPHHSLTVKLPLKQPVRANVDHRVNKWNMQLYN